MKWIYIIKNVDKIVSFSRYIDKKLIRELNVANGDIIKKNFLVLDDLKKITIVSSSELRKELGIDSEKKLVIYAGKVGPGMIEIKNILKAASILPSITFLILGLAKRNKVWNYYNAIIHDMKLNNILLVHSHNDRALLLDSL